MPDGFKVVCYKVWYFEDTADASEKEATAKEILKECKDEVRGRIIVTVVTIVTIVNIVTTVTIVTIVTIVTVVTIVSTVTIVTIVTALTLI